MRMKNGIPESKYYELLEWKDNHLSDFWDLYGRGKRLCDLTTYQLTVLHDNVISPVVSYIEKINQ